MTENGIKLRFDKLYRYPRIQEPCFVTIPLKAGELTDVSRVGIWQEGKEQLSQAKALSSHLDGSVRYLFVRFLADLPGNEGVTLDCRLDGRRPALQEGIRCQILDDGIELRCGILDFAVEDDSRHLFRQFSDGRRSYTARQFAGPFVKDGEGNAYTVRFGRWRLAQQGPVCAVLKTQARCIGPKTLDCECRITAYFGKPWIEISFMLQNTTAEPLHVAAFTFCVDVRGEGGCDASLETGQTGGAILRTTGTAEVEELGEQLSVQTIRTCVGTANYKTRFTMSDGGRALSQTVDAAFLMTEGTEHLAEVLYGTFFADRTDEKGGICATIYQAHQNYPKAVKADGDGIHIMLVPEGVDKVVMESGMGREQRFQLHFHGPEEGFTQLNDRSLIYQMPDRPVLSPGVYGQAGVMPDIFTDRKEDDTEAWFIYRCDSHARCFGMLNWGDAPDPGYTAQGRASGEPVWTNNEYDYPHACALLYARTGQRRFLDYALTAGSHWKDVDVCHYSEDPLLMGGQWEHTGGHVRDGSIVCSHEWVEGLLDCYHFTGEEDYLHTAEGIGGNVLRLLETPMYQKSGEVSARETGWALRTLTALYTETKDDKWVARAKWIVGQFREWAGKYGHWLAPYTDNVMIRVPFMISVAVGSLMRYYREFPSEEIRRMILDAVDDMVANSLFDNGYFYYKEIPSLTRLGNNTLVLEALTAAYQLTGDTSYLKCGRKTFELTLKLPPDYIVFPKKIVRDAVLYGEQPTKDFAQSYLPMAVYYKALMDNHMLPWQESGSEEEADKHDI